MPSEQVGVSVWIDVLESLHAATAQMTLFLNSAQRLINQQPLVDWL